MLGILPLELPGTIEQSTATSSCGELSAIAFLTKAFW